MSVHAERSASGSHRWWKCPASINAEKGLPNEGNDSARWGTANHEISQRCLKLGVTPDTYLGRVLRFAVTVFGQRIEDRLDGEEMPKLAVVQHEVPIDADQIECSTSYVEFVREMVRATGGELLVEQPLPIGQITGEEGATGTGDAAILVYDQREIIIIDLKGGMDQVDAFHMVPNESDLFGDSFVAEPNPQTAMYAGGALEMYGLLGEWDRVRMIIVQPRLRHVSEYAMSVDELRAFLAKLSAAAEEGRRPNPPYTPGIKQCKHCRAKPTCNAHQQWVLRDMPRLDVIADAKPELYSPGAIYEKKAVIVKFVEACEEFVRRELNAQRPVQGESGLLKLVKGRLGARFWKDPAQAERLLREQFRVPIEQAYNMSLISPTDAERLAKTEVLGKRQWAKLQPLYDQVPTKPSIVPASDPRPPLSATLLEGMPVSPQQES